MPLRYFLLLVLGVLPVSLRADSYTYSYTGNYFTSVSNGYTTADRITGEISLSAPLSPNLSEYTVDLDSALSWSFTDGIQTFTNETPNTALSFLVLSTNSFGLPAVDSSGFGWAFAFGIGSRDGIVVENDQFAQIEYATVIPGYGMDASVNPSVGSWVESVTPTPEPSALLLAGTGLIGVCAAARRRFDP